MRLIGCGRGFEFDVGAIFRGEETFYGGCFGGKFYPQELVI